MRTLKKQRNESVKNYEVLQNRCGCGTCGCVCSGGCAGNTDAQVYASMMEMPKQGIGLI